MSEEKIKQDGIAKEEADTKITELEEKNKDMDDRDDFHDS